jgi:aminopeptidase N
MHKPRFIDQLAAELGDRQAFRSLAAGRRAFQPDHVEPQWARDRLADIRHIRLEVALDFERRAIVGTATHRLSAIVDQLARLEFDAAELEIKAVRAQGQPLAFTTDDGKLTVTLSAPLTAGAEIEIAIDYAVVRPRRGLYFVAPDAAHPDKPVEAWTQGEDEDSRYWFPCCDYPNNKATSEIIVTLPERFTAISNGELIATNPGPSAGTRTFHWRQDIPHAAYLIMLAAGEFVEIRDQAGSVPVRYYVHPGREDDARRAFGKTPRMILFYERIIGVPYPWAKYAQVAVTDFIFGGMENTSATTQTADTLHDARAHLDFSSDPLVAHELAHQWWGDLLTCRDWAHAWLNEGFATYFEALWCEEDLGADEFAWNLRQDRANYFSEDAHHYRRPMVCNRYRAPIELFDRFLYEKGGLVLHMLRRLLGDQLFFKSLNLYCTRHRGRNVITHDLQRAFEDTTGRNLDWFFDQWVYKEGHPELEVTNAYDEKRKVASVTVKQTHQVSAATALFRFPSVIALMDAEGAETRHQVEVDRKEHTFHFPSAKAPRAVRFDPGHDLLKTVKHKRSREALETLLKHAPEAIGRGAAASELGKDGSAAAIAALKTAMLTDRFWGVQADAAQALGAIRTEAALAALIEGLSVAHPKARRAVVRALGEFRGHSEAASALIGLLDRGDQSYFVEAEAALALGKTRDGRAFEQLRSVMERPSHQQVITTHALSGMAELRDERAIGVAREVIAYGRPPRVRVAAVGGLAKLAELGESRRAEILDLLIPLADDPEFLMRLRIPAALEHIGDPRALGALRRLEQNELDGRIRRRAGEAATAIVEGRTRGEETSRMRQEIDKLREDNRRFEERLARLETRGGRNGGT